MPEYLLSQLQALMRTARDVYGVDPVIFLVLYLGCAPFWYFSLYRTLREVARAGARASEPRASIAHAVEDPGVLPGAPKGAQYRTNQIMLWSTVFMIATVLPFLYVMLFGRNIPWWVYVLIAALVAQGVYGLVKKIRSTRPA